MGYILFSAEEKLSIEHAHSLGNVRKWNGIIEYSYDNQQWDVWHGEKIVNNKIYMRGINNTVITPCYSEFCYPWKISGNNVRCQGNIENLLDYKSVINNIHPKMDKFCFAYMFAYCQALIECPQLLSTDLAKCCYWRMFDGCDSLKSAPLLPNLSIAKEVIINQHMLDECSVQTININNQSYDINVLKLL